MTSKLKHRHWYALGLLIVTVTLTVLSAALMPKTAKADPAPTGANYGFYCGFTILGRQGCDGYFTNQNFYSYGAYADAVPGNGVLPPCPTCTTSDFPTNTTAASFENELSTYLSQSDNDTQYYYGAVGAGFIIDAMLGETGPGLCEWYTGSATTTTCDWHAGVAYAQQHLTQWEQDVNAYDAAGKVNWDVAAQPYPAGSPDTAHVCYSGQTTCITDPPGQADPGDAKDVAWRSDGHLYTFDSIVFSNPDGSYFRIARQCGNIAGAFEPLAPTGYSMNLTATAVNPTLAPGQNGTIDLALQNNGPDPSDAGELEVDLPASGVTAPCATTCSDPNMQPLSYGGGQYNFSQTSAIPPKPTKPNWCWATIPFPNGTLSTTELSFLVPASASTGTITFDVYYYPADQNGTILHTTVTFTISSVRYPSVVGMGSDIHAGGGVCGGPQDASGYINTNSNAESYGQYVVSASGLINNIGSNGIAGDSSLDLGNAGPNGGYSTVCRPDLYNYAQTNMPTGASWMASGTYDLGTDFNSAPNVTLVNGKAVAYIQGPVNLQGTYSQNLPLTIVVNGDVTISGNINVSGSASGADLSTLPSLGILAGGSIDINDPATQVDAMLFSDNTIDTCYTASPPMPPQCDNTLTVYGFLMAPNILLHRLGS